MTSIRLLLCCLLAIVLISCGGGGGSSDESNSVNSGDSPAVDDGDALEEGDIAAPNDGGSAPPQAGADGWPITISQHLGSLYSAFDWSGPVRDPFRTTVELQVAEDYKPMTADELADLTNLLAARPVIMQIGGMGSAKRNHDNPGQVHPVFAAYLDALIADQGESWRQAVKARAQEVAGAMPEGSQLYWQIGNELNAQSYQENVRLYFGDQSLETIPAYVEYFFAPTVQGFQEAYMEASLPVKVALGSIANFASPHSRAFLDILLNYEIQGDFAPALAGRKVYELVNLLTIHYHMNAGTPDEPELWYEVLAALRDSWFNGAIEGIWTTEDVGIRLAQEGRGAGASLRILARYLHWISDNRYGGTASSFFFFGTREGPQGQRIDDAMAQVAQLLAGSSLVFHDKQFSTDGRLEIYAFNVVEKGNWLVFATALDDEGVDVGDIAVDLPSVDPGEATVRAWLYGETGTRELQPQLLGDGTHISILPGEPLALGMTDTLLIEITP